MKPWARPGRIALLYAFAGLLWIALSTGLASAGFQAQYALVRTEFSLDVLFVIVSAVSLYGLLRAGWRKSNEDRDWHQLLFDRHPFPMAVYDPVTLCFLAANEAALKEYGYGRDEFLRLTLDSIRHPDDRGMTGFPSSPDGMSRRALVRHVRKDGSVFDAESRSKTILYKGRRMILKIAENVTERLASEELVRATVESSPLGMITTDFDLRIVSWN